jgi:hypothetical protein
MQKLYHAIISNGIKDNTYKFALMKFLLDYSNENIQNNEIQISYEDIANKFLEYYWFQECKYKLQS